MSWTNLTSLHITSPQDKEIRHMEWYSSFTFHHMCSDDDDDDDGGGGGGGGGDEGRGRGLATNELTTK